MSEPLPLSPTTASTDDTDDRLAPLASVLDVTRVSRAVILYEREPGTTYFQAIGDWSGLELRGLAPMFLEILAAPHEEPHHTAIFSQTTH